MAAGISTPRLLGARPPQRSGRRGGAGRRLRRARAGDAGHRRDRCRRSATVLAGGGGGGQPQVGRRSGGDVGWSGNRAASRTDADRVVRSGARPSAPLAGRLPHRGAGVAERALRLQLVGGPHPRRRSGPRRRPCRRRHRAAGLPGALCDRGAGGERAVPVPVRDDRRPQCGRPAADGPPHHRRGATCCSS